ncbi:MAG: hypothetical protein ABJ246_12870 [Paracoccaceae bacterium]
MTERDDVELDTLLSGMKPPEPSSDLMSRVLADAYEMQPAPPADAMGQPRANSWQSFLGVFGGWSGLGGLAFAASVGFVVGLSPPDVLTTPLEVVLGPDLTETYEGTSDSFGFGWAFEEG